MRVIIYVPPAPGAARTRRSVEREVRRRGHEIVGMTDSQAAAKAALSSDVADLAAGRPEHLLDLAPWAMGISRSAGAGAGIGIGVLAAPFAWLAGQARRNPARLAATSVLVAGVAVAGGITAGLTGNETPERQADPPIEAPQTAATPPTLPSPEPSSSASPSDSPSPAPSATSTTPPRSAPSPESSSTTPRRTPAPSSPSPSVRTVTPPASPPSSQPASPSSAPTPTPEASEQHCLIRLDALGIAIRVCFYHPFG
ncbi:hypothetical protein ACFWDN_13310 [Micromonospora chalcea]